MFAAWRWGVLMQKKDPIVIRVDLPALESLVAYFKERDNQQKQIDALTAQVQELMGKLSQSSTTLEGAVEEANKP